MIIDSQRLFCHALEHVQPAGVRELSTDKDSNSNMDSGRKGYRRSPEEVRRRVRTAAQKGKEPGRETTLCRSSGGGMGRSARVIQPSPLQKAMLLVPVHAWCVSADYRDDGDCVSTLHLPRYPAWEARRL